jgi:UDP:flavonoid glycosyltransferase YjiC (YdhE family)
VARAAAAAGHAVAFGCPPAMVGPVEAAGFEAHALGAGPTGPPPRLPLRPLDAAREEREFRERFVRLGARHRVPHALALCAAWRPDVLVCDETDFGGMLAAERLGLPYATLLVTAAGSFVRPEAIAEALGELRAEHGLPPDPGLVMLRRHLVLSPFPPGFRDPAHPLPAGAFSFRPPRVAMREDDPPPWPARSGAPAVYFTLGTVFNVESGDLFSRVLAGLRELPADVVVTVGPHVEPEELGPQPGHVHVARYLPQEAILPRCGLVVSHGGSGSVLGALAHGLPSLLIPLGADQPLNAARCVELGVARALDPVAATPASVRAAASELLADPRPRRAAERLRDELAGLPEPEAAVERIAGLAQAESCG